MEIWRDIQGYEGLYQVSNEGRVRSLRFNRERIFGNGVNSRGYVTCVLRKNGEKIEYTMHRLVAQAFIPNPNNYNAVHHINHNRSDNRVENLEWMNRGEHQAMHNRERETKRVNQIDPMTKEIISTYLSISDAARQTGFDPSVIGKCCRGVSYKTYKGYEWEFTN